MYFFGYDFPFGQLKFWASFLEDSPQFNVKSMQGFGLGTCPIYLASWDRGASFSRCPTTQAVSQGVQDIPSGLPL